MEVSSYGSIMCVKKYGILYRCRLDRLKNGKSAIRCGCCLRGNITRLNKCRICGAVVEKECRLKPADRK